LSAEEIPLLRLNPEPERPPPSPSESSRWSTPSLPIVRLLFWPPPENWPSRSTRSSTASVSSSRSTPDAASEEPTPGKTGRSLRTEESRLLSEHPEESRTSSKRRPSRLTS
jgi:hypothetical protein